MDSILRYYDEHVRLVNNALKVIDDNHSANKDLQNSLFTLVHSISNKKGAFNIFFRKYSQDLVDGYNEAEEDYREGFEDYQHEIAKHINQNQFFIIFDPDEKIKHLNINLFQEIDLKKHHFSIKAINNLNNKQLVSKVEEYIAISRHYFQFFFFSVDLKFEYIQDSFTDYFAKIRKESNTKIKSEIESTLENISEDVKPERDRKTFEQFEKLSNIPDDTSELVITNLETDRVYEYQKRLQQIGIIGKQVKKILKDESDPKEKDKSFCFDVTHNEEKEELIKFIRKTSVDNGFFDDVLETQVLIDILFSKDLINDNFKEIQFKIETKRITSFVHFLIPYFEAGLRKKIERSELFKSNRGTLLDAQNFYSSKANVVLLKKLNEEYIDFKRNLIEKEKKH